MYLAEDQNAFDTLFERFPHDRLFLRDALTRKAGNLFTPSTDATETVLLRNSAREIHFLTGSVDAEFAASAAPTLQSTSWGPCICLPSDEWADALKRRKDCFYFDGPMITFSGLAFDSEDIYSDVIRLEASHIAQVAPQGWRSATDFVDKSIAFGVVVDDSVVSYAISNFALADEIEVAVWTAGDHQRKGLAYKSAATLMDFCARNDVRPQWTSWSGNTAACELARKLGFRHESPHEWAFIKPAK